MAGPDERPSRVFKRTKRFRGEATALGLRIRALRESRRWTLDVAAEACQIDLKHLQKVEAGILNVTLVTLVRVAAGFKVPMSALFVGRPKRKPRPR